MINENVKNAYKKFVPSEECHRRIIERARSLDRTREFRKRVSALTRIGYAAAAVVIVFATAFIVSSGMFESERFGAYYNGEAITENSVEAELQSTQYVRCGVSLARQTVVEETVNVKAQAAVPLEVYGENATVSVTGGTILYFDSALQSFTEGGASLPFDDKAKIVWAFPENESGEYELAVKSKDELYKMTAVYDAQNGKVSLKIN